MRTSLIIAIIFLSQPFFGMSQIAMDFPIENEISQLISNKRFYGRRHFKIEYKHGFNQREIFKFKFLNDSVVRRKYKRFKADFIIHGSELTQMNTTEIEVEGQVETTTQSNGSTTTNTFYVVGNDSILFSSVKTEIDTVANSTTTTTKYRSNKTWTGQKTIKTRISDEIIRIQSFVLREENWYRFYDLITITLKAKAEHTSTTTILTYGAQYKGMQASNEWAANIKTERKSKIYYDDNYMIEDFVITEIDFINNPSEKSTSYITVR